ncbi:hypothetical protein ACHAW5_008782 [Stephanodiscus triporus]|uniref:Snurportin-1 n=1 Tax=Stephanodiscus triporus TaxID=2934178 RepID=A0ABD3MZN6_9STRA
MWDDAGTTTTTTDNDKERWIHECIATPFLRQRRQRSELLKRQLLKQRHRGGEGKGGGRTLSSSDTAAAAAAAADASSGVIGDRHVENKDAVDGLGDEDDDDLGGGVFVEVDDDVLRHDDAAHRCDGDFPDALRRGNDDVIADAIPHDVVAPRRPTPLEVFTGETTDTAALHVRVLSRS